MIPVKICGITRTEDALEAARLGAWAVGFIFHPESKRHISPAVAGKIVAKLPPGITPVGVFVDARAEDILQAREESGIRMVQLHGNETAEFCAEIATKIPVIKAFRLVTEADLALLPAYRGVTEFFLLDSPRATASGSWGGNGVLSDWPLAKRAKSEGDVILSGGLTPENVAQAIREVGPAAIDVSSGVESSPGIKDSVKLENFFMNARGAEVSR